MKRRALLVTAIVAVLTLVGGGGAIAYWSATAHLETEAATAKIGMTQTVHPDVASTPLNVTYNASNLTAAGAVTVVNTGSRGAEYSIALTTQSQTTTGLVGAISVAVAPVSSVGACTPTATLSAPHTGTLSATAAFTASGRVDAGTTVILCVKTSLSSAGASTYANASAVLGVQTQLQYAPLAAWTLKGTQVSFTQSVGSSLLFFTDSSARYNILNGTNCLQRYSGGVGAQPRLPSKCGGNWESEWRITALGNGEFHISMTNNDLSSDVAPRWTAVGQNVSEVRVAPISTSNSQVWRITPVSGDEFQIESAAFRGKCLTVGPDRWDGNGPLRLTLTTCDKTARQAFSFAMIGNPIREAVAMTCTGGDWNTQMWFPPNTGYEQEITYRAFVAREATPETRTEIGTGGLSQNHTTMNLNASDLAGFVSSSAGGVGRTWVYVEERITSAGKWRLIAKGQIRTLLNRDNNLNLACGWQ